MDIGIDGEWVDYGVMTPWDSFDSEERKQCLLGSAHEQLECHVTEIVAATVAEIGIIFLGFVTLPIGGSGGFFIATATAANTAVYNAGIAACDYKKEERDIHCPA